jgi:hypothetical protein
MLREGFLSDRFYRLGCTISSCFASVVAVSFTASSSDYECLDSGFRQSLALWQSYLLPCAYSSFVWSQCRAPIGNPLCGPSSFPAFFQHLHLVKILFLIHSEISSVLRTTDRLLVCLRPVHRERILSVFPSSRLPAFIGRKFLTTTTSSAYCTFTDSLRFRCEIGLQHQVQYFRG